MSPDEILVALNQSHRDLVAKKRHNPNGWSFYLGTPRGGPKSNRIFRVTRVGAVTEIKFAISSRRYSVEKVSDFSGDVTALRKLVDSELELFQKHFAEHKDQ